MTRRGHILALMLVVLAAVMAGWTVFANRFTVDLSDRHRADSRVQALWLGRSALDAGVRGTHPVQTAQGVGVVVVSGSVATVDLDGLHVVIDRTRGTERVEEAHP